MTGATMARLREIDLQRQVVQLAEICGWEHVHFRPAQTKHGWRTPGSGTMAKGWPDLTLVRARDRRLIFAELKAQDGYLTDDQTRTLLALRALEHRPAGELREAGLGRPGEPRIEVYVWRPADFDEIEAVLR